jgi:hypothetical protein
MIGIYWSTGLKFYFRLSITFTAWRKKNNLYFKKMVKVNGSTNLNGKICI